jgi:hypothetical protein
VIRNAQSSPIMAFINSECVLFKTSCTAWQVYHITKPKQHANIKKMGYVQIKMVYVALYHKSTLAGFSYHIMSREAKQ